MEVLRLDAGGVTLRLANAIAEVAAALPVLQDFGRRAGLSRQAQNRFEVVFEEMTTNPIRHGFTPGSAQRLEVAATLADGRLRLAIDDDGPAFDPWARPAPAPLADLASAPEGGLGIAMVRKLAASVGHEALPHGNRVVVVLAV